MSSLRHTHRFGPWALAALALTCIGLAPATSQTARAQQANAGEGLAVLTDWPDPATRHDLSHDILPFIDSLFVAYRYGLETGAPSISMSLEWVPSGDAIYRGRTQKLSDVDGPVKMVAVELQASVFTEGLRAGTFSLVVDSMEVGPSPDFVDISLPRLSWENVFVDISEEEARRLFAQGFELRDPEIESVVFAVYDDGRAVAEERAAPRVTRRPRPRHVSVYDRHTTVDVVIDLFWLLGRGRRAYVPDDGTPRGSVGRGGLDDAPRSRAARAGEDRSARDAGEAVRGGGVRDSGDASGARDPRDGDRITDRSGGRTEDRGARDDRGAREEDADGEKDRSRSVLDVLAGSDDEDDDDDDDKLVPYAVAAVGAAGLLAVAGGTIGYFGNVRHARYGISSGLVRRNGGLLLQVGVNEALLADDDRPKRVVAKLLAFGNVFGGSIQPALGAGVLATSRGSEVEAEPSISFGAVARHHALLLYGGYDFYQRGAEFGVALNMRDIWRSVREHGE